MFWKGGLHCNMMFLFCRCYCLNRKLKMIFHWNNTWKYIFCKCSEKMVFPEKIALEYHLPCIIRKDDNFSMNLWTYSSDGRWKIIFLKKKKRKKEKKNACKHDILLIFGKNGISFSYKYDITLLPKKQRWTSPKKYA